MQSVSFWCLFALNIGLSAITFLYAAELFAALVPGRRRSDAVKQARPHAAVLVPAHDEEAVLAGSLAAIRAALADGDRLVVIADNCTDQTARIAAAAGAEVVERNDPVHRGKGYALDAGMQYLASAPPSVVVLIDADCFPAPDAVERLVETAVQTGRPVQSLYLMTAPADAAIPVKVAEFTFMLKNKVRQRGLHRLGLPCHLTGSGMAFPWQTLNGLHLAHGHLVEDMKMGLELAVAGSGPVFCEEAVVLSPFPQTATGLQSQRRRWIGGHLTLIAGALVSVPRALARGNIAGAFAALATAIPPLTVLAALLVASLLVTTVATWGLQPDLLPWGLSVLNITLFLVATLSAWLAFGRAILPAEDLGRAVVLVASRMLKAPFAFFAARRDGWIRTDRRGSGD
ncbi:glycosyltransferase family 2 protein [Rhizobiaceae bacterium BDR2-2]|uniref:Glycosyltransferase family 2 protein n=1 Tax=Ectorhizobium quercum TaxID=2965071 RepID=A0AAE3SUS2_9HYPH|nr:glycosyltransferase family 2 protein [Ectorhizobium quercum]MCX8996219.1 glycosyltransferase family 2 protein [Ectorhizobium quercum]MCX8998742.1 glycosyltransferase family 2 protein [Ectorhizobium quercum]